MSAEGAIAPRRAGGRLAAVLRRRPAVHRPRPDRPRRGGGRLDVGWAHLALSSRPLVSRASRRMARQWRKRRAEAAQGDLAPERSTGSAAAAAQRLAAIIEAAEQSGGRCDRRRQGAGPPSRRGGRERGDRIAAERLRAIADELDPPASAAERPERPPQAGRGDSSRARAFRPSQAPRPAAWARRAPACSRPRWRFRAAAGRR